MATTYRITNGPSKLDIMISLIDGNTSNRRFVKFDCEDEGGFVFMVKATIEELSREDGSGESWNFKAMVYDSRRDCHISVKGYFSTLRRAGTMKTEIFLC